MGCSLLLLLSLLAFGCSRSKPAGQPPIVDDFEFSALNAMAMRLPAPAMTSLQQAPGNYQSLDDLRGQSMARALDDGATLSFQR